MSEQPSLRIPDCDLFAGFTPAQIGAVAAAGTVRTVAEGEVLIEESRRNEVLYIVLEGRFEILLPKTPQRISALQLTTSEEGEAIGEYSFVDTLPAAATVRAVKPSRVLALGHPALHALLDSDSALAAAFYRNLLVRLVRRLRSDTAELDQFGL
jgi:CRP/FNR family cyclic AMP-dependent transcriptional regulator